MEEIIQMAAYTVNESRYGGGTTYSGGMAFGQTSSDNGYGQTSSDNGNGGGGGFDPFNYSGPMLFQGAVVKNDNGQKFVVIGGAGTDANGAATWNAVPLRDFLRAQAAANLASATTAANASNAALNISTGQAVLNFAGGAAAGAAITVAIIATGPVGAAVGLVMAVGGGAQLVGTFNDMRTNPGNYSQQDVVNLTAGVLGGVAGGAGASQLAPTSGTQNGGLNLYKMNHPTSTRSTGWQQGDRFLTFPNQGSAQANWQTNAGLLRSAMREGNPIFETFVDSNGNLMPTRGFLNAERNLLQGRGWTYDSGQRAWLPPGGGG